MYGKDYEYASTRLDGTLVRLAGTGEPVMVQTVSVLGTVTVTPYGKSRDTHEYYVKLDELDVHPVPLGYVNCGGDATYISRMPMRRDYKQGLRGNNAWSSGRNFDALPHAAVRNCIMGRYPTFEKAWKDVQIGPNAVRMKMLAWGRRWAVRSDGVIYYRGEEIVGQVVDGKPMLLAGYTYLQELLEESLQ